MLTTVEICAGAGGQSSGLEAAGFRHVAAIEIDKDACATLKLNRPSWHVIPDDIREVVARDADVSRLWGQWVRST